MKNEDPDFFNTFYGEQLDKYIAGSYHNPEGIYNKNHRAYDFIIEELISSDIEVLLVGIPYNPFLRDKLVPDQWKYYNTSVKEYEKK